MQEQTFMGKLWTEIDSSQFDKQFFHSNFEEGEIFATAVYRKNTFLDF